MKLATKRFALAPAMALLCCAGCSLVSPGLDVVPDSTFRSCLSRFLGQDLKVKISAAYLTI